MKKPTKRTYTRKSKATPEVIISLSVGGKTYQGRGVDIETALQTLPRPLKVVSKGNLRVSVGKASRDLLLAIPQIKRLFYPLARKVIAKQLAFGLK